MIAEERILQAIESLRTELLGKVGELGGEFGELKCEFGELKGEFGELKCEFGELKCEFGELKGEFGELKGEFGELKGEFGELKGEFGELKGEFGELKGEFGELKGEFQGLRGDVDALHLAVVRIENEHGLKIDLALEGLCALSKKVDAQHLELKSDVEAIHMDAGRICRSVNQLQTIVGDHEHRIRAFEQ